jgi:hypothetical protein
VIAAARWVLLLAAVHRQPGIVIGLAIAAAIAAERLRAWLWRSRALAGR